MPRRAHRARRSAGEQARCHRAVELHPVAGYFEPDPAVDEFVLFDDMQYTRRDWRNRNRIKTPAGLSG